MMNVRVPLATCVAVAVCLCVGLLSTRAPAAERPGYRWKIATLAPDGVGWAQHIKRLVLPAIRQYTNGDLVVKVYWGGVMGDDEDYIKKMQIGQLQGAGLAGQGTTMACPEMNVLELPFMFRNFDEVDFIKEKMTTTFDGLMMERGYKLLAWVDQDFDQIYSVHYPTDTLENIDKCRFALWYGALEEELFKTLGATMVPVNVPELAVSIRQGVADASIGPAIWQVGSQMYTEYRYINQMKIRYSPAAIVVTKTAWDSLPPEYKAEFHARTPELAAEFCREVRKDNEKCLQAMIEYGLEDVKVPARSLEAIRMRTRPTWEWGVGDLYPRELLDELTGYLAEFRGQAPTAREVTWSQVSRAREGTPPEPGPDKAPVETAAAAKPTKKAAEVAVVEETAPANPFTPNPAHIVAVQKVLSDAGYYTMEIDGLFGPRTFWGIKKWQREKGMPVTGRIDRPLLDSMSIDY